MSRVFPFVALLCLVGCETAKSSNPTAPSVAGPIGGVNIRAPKPLEPYAGTEFMFNGAAQTLLVENPAHNSPRTVWLELQLATDEGMQNVVFSNERIELGSGGRTSYLLPIAPAPGTYYWRTRALDGANTGPYSDVSSFVVLEPAIINPPVPSEPLGKLSTNKPQFKVTNGSFSGTSGIAYRFEVSRSPDFNQIAAVVTVPLNSSGSTAMSLGELPWKTTFYWRAMGNDGAHESSYSNVASFTTPDPPAVAPPPTFVVDAQNWTSAQWKEYFMNLVHSRGYNTVSNKAMWAVRPDVNARGADFQNAWRGDIRPRIFLPVPGCPSTTNPNAPACSYNRTVDFGNYGGPWQWIERF